MSALLQKAIARLQELPEDRQDELARLVLEYADEEPLDLLTPEQVGEVELALKEMDEGKFASKERMEKFWSKPGS